MQMPLYGCVKGSSQLYLLPIIDGTIPFPSPLDENERLDDDRGISRIEE